MISNCSENPRKNSKKAPIVESRSYEAALNSQLGPLLKEGLYYRCFPKKFAKICRTAFLQNSAGELDLWCFARFGTIRTI